MSNSEEDLLERTEGTEEIGVRDAAVTKLTKEMRRKSGSVEDASKLLAFFYLLGRDYLPLGKIEQLMIEIEIAGDQGCRYTNGWLAKYAQDLVARLIPEDLYQPDPGQE